MRILKTVNGDLYMRMGKFEYLLVDSISNTWIRPRQRRTNSHENKILDHPVKKPFHCNVCNKQFQLKSYFKRHSLTHSDVKLYKCNFCGQQVDSSYNYKQHTSTHTGMVQFNCNKCHKPFMQESLYIKRHMLIHSTESPHTWSFEDQCRMMLQTSERTHVCQICQK